MFLQRTIYVDTYYKKYSVPQNQNKLYKHIYKIQCKKINATSSIFFYNLLPKTYFLPQTLL